MPMLQTDWELTILDANPPVEPEQGLGGCAVGDLDGDGEAEMVVSGFGALLWYRPTTGERGVIARGAFHVGLEIADVDGDGRLEVITPQAADPHDIDKPYMPEKQYQDERMILVYYKPGKDLAKPWRRYVIDARGPAAHDVIVADVDGDGRDELIANDIAAQAAVHVYKAREDPTQAWQKHTIQTGSKEEGLAVGDFDGDGNLEIASGVHLYHQPDAGPYAGPWLRSTVAPDHREMCRVAAVDITGNGRPDLVIVDSEYFEGQLSWFENRPPEAPRGTITWIEHPIERGIYYGHSLHVKRDPNTHSVRIFLGEMAGGGWNAPYNHDARLIAYTTTNGGKTFAREILAQGAGTHEATMFDIDGDGQEEIVGKEWRKSRVHFWKKTDKRSPITEYRHQFIDLDKPEVGTDITATDVDGDGRQDIVCGSWWYHAPTWQRYSIEKAMLKTTSGGPSGGLGVGQVICAYDIDGDGRDELIAIRRKDGKHGYAGLSSDLVWLKAIDPLAGKWEMHEIGRGIGDWPHGSLIAPVLPGGKPALMCSYHSAHASNDKDCKHYPQLFEIPADPTVTPWPKRTLAEILYGEEMVAADITGNGSLDIVAGSHWLENMGDGSFAPHQMIEGFYPARVAVADITGNGKLDVVLGKEDLGYDTKKVPWSPLAYLTAGSDPRKPWELRVIDRVRCAHSIAAADLDGDGEPEIICGEHDPFYPYRTRCHLYVYKKADPAGLTWKRYTLDDRFEHHDGTKIINLAGPASATKLGIISHGWQDNLYVHLWAP